jgi:hypothetical protein
VKHQDASSAISHELTAPTDNQNELTVEKNNHNVSEIGLAGRQWYVLSSDLFLSDSQLTASFFV